jgi:hypothetical protein
MNETLITDKLELSELANKLFMYTDALQWNKLITEVFAENVLFDMRSASGESPQTLTAKVICDMWQQGLMVWMQFITSRAIFDYYKLRRS